MKCSWRRSLGASGAASAVEGLSAGASGAAGAGSPPDAATEAGIGCSGDAGSGERPAGGGGAWELGSRGGLLAASGWNSRTGAGLGGEQAELVGESRGRRGAGQQPGGAQEPEPKCGKPPPPSSSSPPPGHTAMPASSRVAELTSLGRPACPPRCFRLSTSLPPVHGEAGGASSTGVRGASSPGPRPREDGRGLARAQKARARRHSGENSGVPRRGFRGVGEQGDPRGDAGTARRGGGHRVSMEQPWGSPTAGALVPTAGCPGGPKSPRARGTSPPVDGEVCAHGRPGPATGGPRRCSGSLRCLVTRPSRRPDSWVPRASPVQSVALPAAAFPARPPQRRGGGKQSGRHSRPAGRTPARRPVPGPSGGEGAFRPLGFFLPRWLRRPRYRELPPRCPNTSAAAASPPLIGRCCCDVTQTPPLGRHGPRPHSAHRHTHVDPELLD